MLKLLVGLVGLISISAQQSATLTMGGTRVILSNYDGGKMSFPAPGEKEHHFQVSGPPVQIEAPEKGLTVRAKNVDVMWADVDPKTTEFKKGRLEGDAVIIVDSAVSQKALEENAKAQSKKTPPAATETRFVQANSDLFLYAGTVKQGTVTMPGHWTFHQVVTGVQELTINKKKVKVAYVQTLDVDGTSGTIDLVPGKDGTLNQLSTGHIAGPVHFKMEKVETPEDTKKPSTSTYSGVADQVDIDLVSKPGTITASGNVNVDAVNSSYASHFSEDRFIFFVNDKLEPQGLQFFGKPGSTTAKTKGGSK